MAGAVEIRAISVGALKSGLELLAADFTKQSGDRINYTFTNPANLNSVLAEGQFDVIIAATASVEELEKSGGLHAGSRVSAVRVGIGVAVREGTPKPDLSTPDAFKKAMRTARNFVYATPTPNGSGVLTMRILAAAGLADAVKAKGKQGGLGPGKELIAKGAYEMGLFHISEAAMPGVIVAGPVPLPLQQYSHYDAAVMAGAANQDAAAGFVKYITAKPASAIWKSTSVEAMRSAT